jgi:asparagine synthase (glutamine-hydrolysing)
MCGIVGFASTHRSVAPELVVRMRDTLRHRGPDDEGAWTSPDRRLALGHRRLSIIDLSPAGRQPLSDASASLRIVFNGEIYNYQAAISSARRPTPKSSWRHTANGATRFCRI